MLPFKYRVWRVRAIHLRNVFELPDIPEAKHSFLTIKGTDSDGEPVQFSSKPSQSNSLFPCFYLNSQNKEFTEQFEDIAQGMIEIALMNEQAGELKVMFSSEVDLLDLVQIAEDVRPFYFQLTQLNIVDFPVVLFEMSDQKIYTVSEMAGEFLLFRAGQVPHINITLNSVRSSRKEENRLSYSELSVPHLVTTLQKTPQIPKTLDIPIFVGEVRRFNMNLTKLSFLKEQLQMKKAKMEDLVLKLESLRESTASSRRVEDKLMRNQDLKVAHGDMHFNLIQSDKFQEEKKDQIQFYKTKILAAFKDDSRSEQRATHSQARTLQVKEKIYSSRKMRVMFELGAFYLNDYTIQLLCKLLYLNKPTTTLSQVEEQQLSSSLGSLVHFLNTLIKIIGAPTKYRMFFNGSKSCIQRGQREFFPLHSAKHERGKFDTGVHLLFSNLLEIANFLGHPVPEEERAGRGFSSGQKGTILLCVIHWMQQHFSHFYTHLIRRSLRRSQKKTMQ